MIKFKCSSFISEPLDMPNYEYPLVGTILHFNYSTLYWLFFKIIRILMLTYLISVTIKLIGKHLILKLTRVPSARVAILCGGCLPGGCLSGGVFVGGVCLGGVCLPRGCLPRGCLPRGICLGGVWLEGCTPPPVNRMTDRQV